MMFGLTGSANVVALWFRARDTRTAVRYSSSSCVPPVVLHRSTRITLLYKELMLIP